MELTVDQLLAEAREMALELRVKDKLIAAQQARIAGLEVAGEDGPGVPGSGGPPAAGEAAGQDGGPPG